MHSTSRWPAAAQAQTQLARAQMMMISALPSELSEIGRRDALREEAEQLFAEVDEDGSGTLDAEEVQQLASRLGLKLDRVAAKEAMDVMDADGGGDVDFEEFWMWWVENRKRAPFRFGAPPRS